MVEHPDQVSLISQDEADEILRVCKKICELCKTEEGIEDGSMNKEECTKANGAVELSSKNDF